MGAVQIDTYNVQLMNVANYSDKKSIKKLLKNLKNLKGLAERGDTVAAAIYVDLHTAISHDALLNDMQRDCLGWYFTDNMTLKEIGEMIGRQERYIHSNIEGGIKKIQKALQTGAVYRIRRMEN